MTWRIIHVVHNPGQSSPPRRSVLVQVRVTPRERMRWHAAALREELRLSEYVRFAVRLAIERAGRGSRDTL